MSPGGTYDTKHCSEPSVIIIGNLCKIFYEACDKNNIWRILCATKPIAIIDYGSGNIQSIVNALNYLKIPNELVDKSEKLSLMIKLFCLVLDLSNMQ